MRPFGARARWKPPVFVESAPAIGACRSSPICQTPTMRPPARVAKRGPGDLVARHDRRGGQRDAVGRRDRGLQRRGDREAGLVRLLLEEQRRVPVAVNATSGLNTRPGRGAGVRSSGPNATAPAGRTRSTEMPRAPTSPLVCTSV
jgi:hypothetical protein